MNKKYVVRLSDQERQACMEVIKRLKGTSQKVRRAQILLKADADGPAWTDARIAEAFHCRVQTIENLRRRLVTEGFEVALNRKKRETPPTPPRLDGLWTGVKGNRCSETWVTGFRLGSRGIGLPNGVSVANGVRQPNPAAAATPPEGQSRESWSDRNTPRSVRPGPAAAGPPGDRERPYPPYVRALGS